MGVNTRNIVIDNLMVTNTNFMIFIFLNNSFDCIFDEIDIVSEAIKLFSEYFIRNEILLLQKIVQKILSFDVNDSNEIEIYKKYISFDKRYPLQYYFNFIRVCLHMKCDCNIISFRNKDTSS